MNNYVDKIVKYSFIESQIYGYSPLTCIYYLSLFDKYCEVEVRSLSELSTKTFNLDNWLPDLTFNYTNSQLDNEQFSLSCTFVINNDSDKLKPRFLRKRDLLYESILLSHKKGSLPDNIFSYWVKKEYGLIACSYSLTAGVDIVLVPQLTMIELFKFTNKQGLHPA